MKIKRIFKTLPTSLAILGGISVVVLIVIVGVVGGAYEFKILATFGMLGLLFFISELVLQKKHLKELRIYKVGRDNALTFTSIIR